MLSPRYTLSLFSVLISLAVWTSAAQAQDAPNNNLYAPANTGLTQPGIPGGIPPADPGAQQFDENGQPIAPQGPNAINQYGERFRSNNEPVFFSGAPIPPGAYSMFLVTAAGSDAAQAIIRLTSAESVTGCATVEPPAVQQDIKGPTLWLTVTDTGVEVDRSVRYAHFQCKTSRQYATTDITLDRDTLINEGIDRIALRSSLGTDFYKVSVDEHSLTLTPQSPKYFKPLYASNRPDPLIVWFYPDNTLVLNVLGEDHDLRGALSDFAQRRGLVPLESRIPDFTPRMAESNTLYFLVPPDALFDMPAPGESLRLGELESTRTFFGDSGAYEQPVPVAVFARRPGLED